MEASHEINYDVVDENANGGEGQVGEEVGDRESCTSVHAVTGLEVPIGQRADPFKDEIRTCLFRIVRPIIMRGISPNASNTETKTAMKTTLPRVKPPAAVNGRLK